MLQISGEAGASPKNIENTFSILKKMKRKIIFSGFSGDAQGRPEGLLVFPQHISSLEFNISAGNKPNSCYCVYCLHKILQSFAPAFFNGGFTRHSSCTYSGITVYFQVYVRKEWNIKLTTLVIYWNNIGTHYSVLLEGWERREEEFCGAGKARNLLSVRTS